MQNRKAAYDPHYLFLFLSLSFVVCASVGAEDLDYWQIVLTYDSEELTLMEASEMGPMRKKVRSPGLLGAPGVIECRAEWIDESGDLLATTEAQIPVGRRVAETSSDHSTEFMPQAGVIVIRIPGPAHGTTPRSIRLVPTQAKKFGGIVREDHKAFRELGSQDLLIENLKRVGQTSKVEGPISATKVRDTGDDGNRFVLVFVGDGYTAGNLSSGDYDTDISNLLNSFETNNSWSVFFDGTNFYRVDVESNEEGADEERGPGEPSPPPVDTYFNTSFWTQGLERLLDSDTVGEMRAIMAADDLVGVGVWDQIVMVVNSDKYGGSGGDVVVTSVNPGAATAIMIHELGHSFVGLADEYTSPYPGYPPGDPEPNVDFDTFLPMIKWHVWIGRDTDLPTPDIPANDGVVGAFEGARYLENGIYRPMRDCLMRTVSNPNFCKICNEAHILEYMRSVELTDNVIPPAGSAHKIEPPGMNFGVVPLPIEGFEYEWSLGGQVLEEAVKPELQITQGDVTPDAQELKLVVSYPSPHVRQEVIEKTFVWYVQDSGADTFTPTPTRTHTPTFTLSPTQTFTSTETPTMTDTPTSTMVFTDTHTPTATATETSTQTSSPTLTETLTTTETASPSPTERLLEYDLNGDNTVNAVDLVMHLFNIESETSEVETVFDFSLDWQHERQGQ
ncbi:MAG: hypothetical protein H6751_01370 [Candidatus Omnitrophica bacterium]|nr:hypothetical protein [Candidatus Omnitrophota bacterium]MCB9781601.1 hypothetical protein [Candidatus Omnitrophota bacterium]